MYSLWAAQIHNNERKNVTKIVNYLYENCFIGDHSE